MDSIFDWPGKSDDEGNEHPAVPYMLDVAACAARPVPADAMTAHPVSTLVNKPAADGPRCVEPVAA